MALTTAEERLAVVETRYEQALERIAALEARLPNSSIISPSLLTRVFTAWAYNLLAGLIIAIPLYCIIFGLAGLGSSLSNY